MLPLWPNTTKHDMMWTTRQNTNIFQYQLFLIPCVLSVGSLCHGSVLDNLELIQNRNVVDVIKEKKKKKKNHMKLKTGFSVWSVIPWLIVVLVFYFVRTNKPFFWHHSDMCPLFRSFHWFLFFGVRCVGRVTLTQLSCHGDILNQMWCRFFNNLSCSTYQRITEKKDS